MLVSLELIAIVVQFYLQKNIPLSELAKSLLENRLISLKELLTAGDDYQLAFSFDKKT